MFNFLDPKLLPKVKCNSPVTDNYEASNLISDNFNIKMRGFLCYTTCKPPIELEFEFICPIRIDYINLNTTVGNQKCTGIEIFAKNSSSSPYISISKTQYDKEGVIFCNTRTCSKKLKELPFCDNNKHIAYFKRDTFRIFLNAISIKVLIFRTKRCVPCLNSIEVWGCPSKSCSTTTLETIKKLVQGLNVHNNVLDDKNSPSTSDKDKFIIPEDFKDNLTFEIMTIPMTLPSGKTVDQSTLEKHLENEKYFCRKPGDPFTGLKFTDTRKPVLNVGLKSRIDMFLLQHSHRPETFNLKRTLGGSNSGDLHQKRKFLYNNFSNNKKCKIANNCCLCKSSDNLYTIPCFHLYCRLCLSNVSLELSCNVCNAVFKKCDIEKYHG